MVQLSLPSIVQGRLHQDLEEVREDTHHELGRGDQTGSVESRVVKRTGEDERGVVQMLQCVLN